MELLFLFSLMSKPLFIIHFPEKITLLYLECLCLLFKPPKTTITRLITVIRVIVSISKRV